MATGSRGVDFLFSILRDYLSYFYYFALTSATGGFGRNGGKLVLDTCFVSLLGGLAGFGLACECLFLISDPQKSFFLFFLFCTDGPIPWAGPRRLISYFRTSYFSFLIYSISQNPIVFILLAIPPLAPPPLYCTAPLFGPSRHGAPQRDAPAFAAPSARGWAGARRVAPLALPPLALWSCLP